MGRNNTKAVKNIAKMYEQLGLAQDDIFHKTKLLLSIYRDVVWATLSDCNCVNEEIYYYGDDLTDALVYLEEFAPDIERSEFERHVCNLFENKWMIDLIDKAMSKVYDYYNNGRLYHEILSKSYLTAFRYTESELLKILNLERSTFYDRKKEAVMLLGIALWGYDMYLSGMGVTAIQYELEKAGRLTAMGKERWFSSYIAKMLRNSFYCGIITYHKEYTPDFLKQKKIKNYGDLEYIQVQGTHEPIVTVEEYEQVQKLMNAKSAAMKNHNKGKRRVGRMQHTTAFGRLMICQCGNKFNLRFHSRDGRTDGVDYQCYTSVNRGSVAKRLNKGISIEHSCESPYIQGWKLEMMAEQVFDRYIENADKVMDLSYAMLEKHIADQKELPDNTDVIQRKQGEIEKLMNKRTNLIEMRAEGDIDKEMFRSKKQEIEDRVAKLTEEIKGLQPEKEPTSNEDYSAKLLELRKRLKEYTGFDYSVIPESIVEAFIERIWVSKDEFRWYLRTGNKAEGEFDPDDHIKIGSFTLTIADAKKYIYSFSTRRRVYKWVDLNVSVWI